MTTATTTAPTTGTIDWSMRTGGHLAAAERRRLIADLARVQIRNALGRLSLLAHLNPGRNAYVPPAHLVPPDSPLTRSATDAATRVLPPALLNHGYRTYRFGRALGELEKIDVDAELLFAAALLHDTGLVVASGRDDFTLTSARVARDVAEQARLSTTATETLQSAITMHHSPRVTLAAGPVPYLLSAGAGVDVIGMRCWDLSPALVADAVRDRPPGRLQGVLQSGVGRRGSSSSRRPGPVGASLRRVHARHRTRPIRRVSRIRSDPVRSIELTGERLAGGRSGTSSPSECWPPVEGIAPRRPARGTASHGARHGHLLRGPSGFLHRPADRPVPDNV
jgi:hypothetical protein